MKKTTSLFATSLLFATLSPALAHTSSPVFSQQELSEPASLIDQGKVKFSLALSESIVEMDSSLINLKSVFIDDGQIENKETLFETVVGDTSCSINFDRRLIFTTNNALNEKQAMHDFAVKLSKTEISIGRPETEWENSLLGMGPEKLQTITWNLYISGQSETNLNFDRTSTSPIIRLAVLHCKKWFSETSLSVKRVQSEFGQHIQFVDRNKDDLVTGIENITSRSDYCQYHTCR
jgi:hypothetical protein